MKKFIFFISIISALYALVKIERNGYLHYVEKIANILGGGISVWQRTQIHQNGTYLVHDLISNEFTIKRHNDDFLLSERIKIGLNEEWIELC